MDAPDERESAYGLLQRGQELISGQHFAQAAVVLARADRLAPGRGSILEALARAEFNSRQYAQAAETFGRLLEVDPSGHYAHYGRGLSLLRSGRRSEARLHLRLATVLYPSSALYRTAYARLGPEPSVEPSAEPGTKPSADPARTPPTD